MRRFASIAIILVGCVSTLAAPSQTMNNGGRRSSWQRSEVIEQGEKFLVSYTSPLPTKEERARFPYRVMLVYEYGQEGTHRLPNEKERARIESYETAIRVDLARDEFGLAVTGVANDGLYQLILYAQEGPKAEARLLSVLPKEVGVSMGEQPVVVQFGSEFDPTWSYVSALIKRLRLE